MPTQQLSAERIREIQDLAREGNAIDSVAGEVKVLDIPPPPTTRWGRIYRAAAFQMCVVAGLAFAGPGMSEAITALGGGGLAAPWAVNAATSVSYVMVATMSALGGPIASRLGIKYMLIIGAATFPINGSAYYVNSKYGTDWYLVLGRAIYGVGFGLWYVAEAAMVLSYPEEGRRGKYLGMWVASRNGGQLIAGAIALSRNVQNAAAGAVATSTYLIFLAIECMGFPISWLVSHPHKVIRADGVPIIMAAKHPWKTEFRILWRAATMKRMLLIIPVAVNSFYYGGIAYTYLAQFFTVRSRALSGVLQPGCAIITTLLYGRYILDNGRLNQHRRAQVGFLAWCLPMLACVCWLVANRSRYTSRDTLPAFDWTDAGWANAYLPFLFLQCVGYWGQSYVYWLLSCFATDVQSNARNGGIFRMWEAVGQAISYGISSRRELGSNPLISVIAMVVFQIPFTWMIIRTVPKYRADDQHRPTNPDADVENKIREEGAEAEGADDKAVEAHEMGATKVGTRAVL